MSSKTPTFGLSLAGQAVPLGLSLAGGTAFRSRADVEAENAVLRAEVARLRAGEEPCDSFQGISTGGQFLWVLGSSDASVRQRIAASAVRALNIADRCVMGDHESLLRFHRERSARLEGTVADLRAETRRLGQVLDGSGRGVAMALEFRIAQAAT